MPRYRIPVQFVFSGYFEVDGNSPSEAAKTVKENCGLVLGGDIHTNLNVKDLDWEFDAHPEKKIFQITKIRD